MNKSTGGLVRLDRTSVKEGSLFLRLLSQSSCCCLCSSSMAVSKMLRGRALQRTALDVQVDEERVSGNHARYYVIVSNHLFPLRLERQPISAMSSFAKALSPALREIRILCCQTAQASAGTRYVHKGAISARNTNSNHHQSQFVVSEYPAIKKHNPDLPVLIREAAGTPARVFARFGAFLCPSARAC
jgi:hypothetical protein